MDLTATILAIVTALFGGGIVQFLNWHSNTRKNKVDITASNIETAAKLRDIAMQSYTTAEEKIAKVEAELAEIRKELDMANSYIAVLVDLLENHNVAYPVRNGYQKVKTKKK
jgi:hypothetical protein